jgi:hypothetical protein
MHDVDFTFPNMQHHIFLVFSNALFKLAFRFEYLMRGTWLYVVRRIPFLLCLSNLYFLRISLLSHIKSVWSVLSKSLNPALLINLNHVNFFFEKCVFYCWSPHIFLWCFHKFKNKDPFNNPIKPPYIEVLKCKTMFVIFFIIVLQPTLQGMKFLQGRIYIFTKVQHRNLPIAQNKSMNH